MKAYAITHVRFTLIIATLVASVAFVGCGRAKLKSLKKGNTEFVTEGKNTDITADPVAERWQDRNDEASKRRHDVEAADRVDSSDSATQAEAQLAMRIKNIDLQISKNGEKKISLRIDKPNTLPTSKLINEQELVLRKLNQYDKVNFSESTENTFIGEGNNIQIILTQENTDGLYAAQIKEVNGATVRALIRLNSTAIKIDDKTTSTTQDQSIRKFFESTDLKIQTRIVQLYSLASNEQTRIPLESAANKIKLNGLSENSNTKFIIKGYSSDTEEEPSPAKLVASAYTSRTEVNSYVVELGQLFDQNGRGKLILESYSHVEANRYAKIISTNEQNLRTIDADVLRMILKYVDQNGKSNRLVVDLQFKSLFEQQSEEAQKQLTDEEKAKDGLMTDGLESKDSQTAPQGAASTQPAESSDDNSSTAVQQEAVAAPAAAADASTPTSSDKQDDQFYEVLGEGEAQETSSDKGFLDSLFGSLPFLSDSKEEEKPEQQLGPVGAAHTQTAQAAPTQVTTEVSAEVPAATNVAATPGSGSLVSLYNYASSAATTAWNWITGTSTTADKKEEPKAEETTSTPTRSQISDSSKTPAVSEQIRRSASPVSPF